MEDLKQIQEFFSKPLEERMSLDDQAKAYFLAKVKRGEIDTLPENPKAAFLAQMTKDQMDHDKETLRRERGLEENVYVEAFKLEKALKGMGHDVKVKYLDDFGKDVFEIYSKKPLDDDSIFYDAEKLGYPNVRVFDHSNESVKEATKEEETEFHTKLDKLVHDTFGKRKGEMEEEISDYEEKEADYDKLYSDYLYKMVREVAAEKGYSKYLVSKDNPKGETDGLTPATLNKILMNVIKDIKETIELGKNLNEELCPKGKAYIKKRKAAGEKSSAYLSGRAVKVCKGQMKG